MSPALVSHSTVDIIDIRSNEAPFSAENAIYDGLNPPEGEARSFPTLLLYDAKGLQLFEEITYLDEYYLTNAEIELLTAHAKTLAERLPDNAQLVELGSGNLRKIEILLQEVERRQKRVDYFALDLSLEELQRTFAEVSPQSYQYVRLHALHGTYDDAMEWLRMPENRQQPTYVLSLGSSLGNFSRPDAAVFLNQFARLLGPSDSLIVGLDGCTERDRIYKAYNDSKGTTHQFYRNGLLHANTVLGYEAFKPDEWTVECIYNEAEGCHQAFYVPVRDVTINGTILPKGEKIIFEEAYKYDLRQRDQLWRNAGLISVAAYANSANNYHLHMLSPATLDLPTKASEYAAHPVPTINEWKSLWTAWDIATKSMVPREELLSQPIKLRNALIFYLGHIPTFLDIHLTRGTRGKPTDPKSYQLIFERGVDPDVDDPEQCHSHSEIPDEWPALDEILDYQDRVRLRLQSILKTEKLQTNRLLSEAVWIGFEHEIMHLETFLYMLLQSDQIQPPLGVEKPDFAAIALEARKNAKPNKWFSVPQQTFTVGLDDADLSRLPAESFGWDNEKPQRVVRVPAFEAQGRPVTNGEYAQYLQANGIHQTPAAWIASASTPSNGVSNGHHTDGESNGHDFVSKHAIRTVFGPVPLAWAADWPVMASYDELAAYAKWMNCRLPTFEEARSIYKYSSALKKGETERNGVHSVADGEDPNNVYSDSDIDGVKGEIRTDREWNPCKPRSPDHQPVKGRSLPSGPVFTDLDDGGSSRNSCSYNVGFEHWHPIPVTPFGDTLAGQGGLGGVWEWTSTPLERHEGFEAMEIYPGYTADFFDGKHNIVLGGSWATHPRIAGRTTFVNWYQHNYPYAWTGARLVRDI